MVSKAIYNLCCDQFITAQGVCAQVRNAVALLVCLRDFEKVASLALQDMEHMFRDDGAIAPF